MRPYLSILAVVFGCRLALGQGVAVLPAVELRCEYQVNPLAVQTAVPRFSWEMGAAAGARGVVQGAYRIEVASTAEKLARDQADLWDSGKVASDATLQVEYRGTGLRSEQQGFWRVKLWDGAGAEGAWSVPATFSVGLLEGADWQAKWIGFPGDDGNKKSEPSPCFRKEFSLAKPLARGLLHVCGLGQYELTVNGKKAGDGVLGPAWTNYTKTCDYDTIDVTALLQPGANAVGIMLGNGMYNVLDFKGPDNTRLRYSKFAGSMGNLMVIGQLELEYADGSRQRVGTDASWKTHRGPVTFSHEYGGEEYDARLEMPGWDSPAFADGAWQAAEVVTGPGNGAAKLEAALAPAIKVVESLKPVKITQPRPGVWVYDFGRNISAWPHMTFQGPAGASVKMMSGETVGADGMVSQGSFHGPTWWQYTLKGGAAEEWRPRFATMGYRYMSVEGAVPDTDLANGSLPRISAVTSEFVHGDVRQVGTFESSNETLNRIHALINAAILSNTQSVLTDCPHREKLGWLEQSHLMCDAIGMNYDVAALYTKMCRDMRDAQTAEGLVPDIAPEYTVFAGGFRDSPEWGSAAVIDPWFVYQTYGDTRLLREQYGVMKKYVAYLATKSTGELLNHGLGDWYDIGPKKPGVSQLTTIALTSSATYYRDLDLMRCAAEVLHEEADARQYAAAAEKVKAAFNTKFFDAATATYEKGSQTSQAMPVALGLVAPAQRAAVVGKLTDAVTANKFHVTAGDVGFSYVVQTLTDADRGDVMLQMMLQSDGPGYVEQLKKGATALTEAWDALASSSQNHLMLGHAEAWLYRGLAGIQAGEGAGDLAFKHFVIAPQVAGDVADARAEFHSPRGMIRSAWKRAGTTLTLTVEVPANCTATVRLPATGVEGVTESGMHLLAARSISGVRFVNAAGGKVTLEVGSGTYVFVSTLPG